MVSMANNTHPPPVEDAEVRPAEILTTDNVYAVPVHNLNVNFFAN